MALFNAMTGLKRKKTRRDVSRKKRDSLSSTVGGRMTAKVAMEAFSVYLVAAKIFSTIALHIMTTVVNYRSNPALNDIVSFLLKSTGVFFTNALDMIILDSELMDVHPEKEENAGFRHLLEDITLDSYSNDDECQTKTRFTKGSVRLIIEKVGLGPITRVHY
jgi:hypothetical protein